MGFNCWFGATAIHSARAAYLQGTVKYRRHAHKLQRRHNVQCAPVADRDENLPARVIKLSDYPKFPLTPNYPAVYSRAKAAAEQSAVPSQQGPAIEAYYPGGPTDLMRPPSSGTAQQAIDNLAVVRAVFDSRPLNAYDFTFRDKFQGGAAVFGGFAVPKGYIAIVRNVSVALFGEVPLGGVGFVTPFGDLQNNLTIPQMNLIINGGQQAQWTVPLSANSPNANPIAGFAGVLAEDAYLSSADFKTFVVLNEESICNIQVLNWTDTANRDVLVEYSGQLLLSDGRTYNMQVGNADPEPVRNE